MGKYIEVGLLLDNLENGNVKDYEEVKEAVDNTPIAFDTDRVILIMSCVMCRSTA